MCNALLGNRGPAHETRRPLRGNDRPRGSPPGRPARRRARYLGRGAAASGAIPSAPAAMTVIDIGEIVYPFIACAADAVVSVAMKAAAERVA